MAVWDYLAGILVVWGLMGLLVLAACALVVGAAVHVVGRRVHPGSPGRTDPGERRSGLSRVVLGLSPGTLALRST